ncbi:MAG: deoxyribodipyrimidine photo-lyase [Rhodobacteraceae bacterium HLUCCA12]|nr:MAG: deoxyribodipyrimidine photo-lyase [Rhodobacteraceae bacterium HLUCCA12]
MLSLVWFKRDLRVVDHPALAAAAERGAVIPLYIVEPDLWAQPDASGRQWAFVAECLTDLRRELVALGQPLLIRTGEAVEVLARLKALTGFVRIVSHQETGNDWTFARDRHVAQWARAHGVEWVELPQSGVARGARDRDGWAARRNAFMAGPLARLPALEPVIEASGGVPSARALNLADDRCGFRQIGGRAQALDLMESFLAQRGQNYRTAMSSPLSAERACSRLSPYLAHGVLSPREVVHATAAARHHRRGACGWSASLGSFESRLAWRDHFIQKLEDEPTLEYRTLHPAMNDLRPRQPDRALLAAWERGETGLPFVDACMRYLRATGWLNFRMRAMLVSVAAYQLWLDWRAFGPVLARLFTDYEPGIHWSQVQMQSGTTGINAIRMYNPVKQGLDQDPDGNFVRSWVPELALVPDAFVHEPWRWPDARRVLGKRYPEPVVDPAAAAREARARIAAQRGVAGFADQAARIAQRHASRKGRGRPGSRDRRPADRAQLSLDL